MGQEAKCEVHFGGKVSAGKALLETDDLIFRGDFRLAIPYKSIQEVDATDGVLRVVWPARRCSLWAGWRISGRIRFAIRARCSISWMSSRACAFR